MRPVRCVAAAVLDAVELIRRLRIPPQIGCVVIQVIAVVVAALHPFGAGSNKSLRNKAVYEFLLNSIAVPKLHHQSSAKYARLHQNASRLEGMSAIYVAAGVPVKRSHAPMVTDLIQPFPAKNRPPTFISHDALLGRLHDETHDDHCGRERTASMEVMCGHRPPNSPVRSTRYRYPHCRQENSTDV